MRLCVETLNYRQSTVKIKAAAFVRLCVETMIEKQVNDVARAAAFVRLCVETIYAECLFEVKARSRLRAAVC